MCDHESRRPRNNDLMCDVYDSPEWQKLMGPPGRHNKRLGWQFCIDAIPSNAEGSHSVKPGVAQNNSLSPTERVKPKNMMLMIVIPTSIKDPNVKKYYDWMATYELNDLFYNGKFVCTVSYFCLIFLTTSNIHNTQACEATK